MERFPPRPFAPLPSLFEDAVALVPELFGDDRVHVDPDPLVFGFYDPVLLVSEASGVVRAAETLCRGIPDQTVDRRVGELGTVPGAVAGFVQEPGDSLLPAVANKKLVEALTNRRFFCVGDKLAILPAVPEGCGAAKGLAELCPNGDGSRNPIGDLLALPLGHGGDHRVEEPARGRRGVDRFLKRYQIRMVLLEKLGELKKLLRVPGEPCELREDEARDVARLHVAEHPLGLGMTHDRFPAHRFEVVDLDDLPTLRLGIEACAPLMVLGALAPGLILSRDADPDARSLWLFLPRLTHDNLQLPRGRYSPLSLRTVRKMTSETACVFAFFSLAPTAL